MESRREEFRQWLMEKSDAFRAAEILAEADMVLVDSVNGAFQTEHKTLYDVDSMMQMDILIYTQALLGFEAGSMRRRCLQKYYRFLEEKNYGECLESDCYDDEE